MNPVTTSLKIDIKLLHHQDWYQDMNPVPTSLNTDNLKYYATEATTEI